MDTFSLIWIIRCDSDRYQTFDQKEYHSKEWLALLDKFKEGRSLQQDWQAIRMVLFEGDGEEESEAKKNKPVPDITNGVVTLAISSRARTILEPLIANQVEFLPLLTPYGTYFELNIARVDALDVPNSSVEFFDEREKRVMDVERYAFHWDKLEGKNLFLLSSLGISKWFASELFRQKVEENRLTGLTFVPVSLV